MGSSSCFSFGGGGVRHEQVPHEQEDDALLARELNALSMEERNRIYDEVNKSSRKYSSLPYPEYSNVKSWFDF